MQIFANGVLVDSKKGRDPYKGEAKLYLGGGFPDPHKRVLGDWLGRIKKAKIYAVALTPAQVVADSGVSLVHLVLKTAPDALRISVPSKKFGEEQISPNPDGTLTASSIDTVRFQLVTRGDKTRAVVSVPAEFAPSGTFYDKGRKAQVNISRCGVGPAAEAISFLRKGKSNDCVLYVASDPQHKAIEVPYKSMKAGIDLFLWNDDPPHPETIHTRFIFNDDGSISPSPTSPDVKDGDPLQFRLGKKKGQRCNDIGACQRAS
jgi:hypothetical protein